MKPMVKNILLSLIALLGAALVAFSFVRAALPATEGNGEPNPGMSDRADPPARPDTDATGWGDDTPITDNKIGEGTTETPPTPPDANFPTGGTTDAAQQGGQFFDPMRKGGNNNTLPMIFATAGGALFAFALTALLFINAGKRKETFTKGGGDDDADLSVRAD